MSIFPPKMANRRPGKQILRSSPSPKAEIRSKLTSIISRHEQMKIAYLQLKAQIGTGLMEAEEVFASLALPLMKLVGLKTAEMEEEGRFTTITVVEDLTHGSLRNGQVFESQDEGRDQIDQIGEVEEESYENRANVVGCELREKQRTQVMQLVHLLRQIETQVNSSEDTILRALDRHTSSFQKLFQKSVYHLSSLHSQNEDTFLVSVKLLHEIFNIVNLVLGSVKSGVEGLMEDLSKQMCNPMVEYVKGLKEDMKNGTSLQLVAMVGEMERMIRDGRLELEHARKKARIAEEGKIHALCKLKATKERTDKMKEYLKSILESKLGLIEPASSHKIDKAKDDKLLWEILNMKTKYQALESPVGPKEQVYFDANDKTAAVRTQNRSRPVTRSYTGKLSPHIPLGSSTPLAIQQAASRRRITP
ncbi:hypothetical protein Tsubulata_017432 [Turnera subulata]|uniref:Uncharacterized protein n=1 Tax=Turnera subulata TaxID=218843 RepID=A0A9Q0FXJ9_9ROSI|nr:hypothetical protein Tsubulata_017432 [Turnera subulata]